MCIFGIIPCCTTAQAPHAQEHAKGSQAAKRPRHTPPLYHARAATATISDTVYKDGCPRAGAGAKKFVLSQQADAKPVVAAPPPTAAVPAEAATAEGGANTSVPDEYVGAWVVRRKKLNFSIEENKSNCFFKMYYMLHLKTNETTMNKTIHTKVVCLIVYYKTNLYKQGPAVCLPSPQAAAAMTVTALKAELKARGLASSGDEASRQYGLLYLLWKYGRNTEINIEYGLHILG